MIPLADRVSIIIGHAEAFADEAADLRIFELSDRLRLKASRLAIDQELVEAKVTMVRRTRVARIEAIRALRAHNHRFEVELSTRLPAKDAAEFLKTARVSATSLATFRLRRLTLVQEQVLGPIVANLRAALAAVERADEEHLTAVAAEIAASAACNGRAARLRVDLERAKAELLAVLPQGCDAWRRVRRRVVRTRRPDARPSPASTAEGDPVD